MQSLEPLVDSIRSCPLWPSPTSREPWDRGRWPGSTPLPCRPHCIPPHCRVKEQMLLWVRLQKECLVPINPHKPIINSGQKQCLASKKKTAEPPQGTPGGQTGMTETSIKRLRIMLEQGPGADAQGRTERARIVTKAQTTNSPTSGWKNKKFWLQLQQSKPENQG